MTQHIRNSIAAAALTALAGAASADVQIYATNNLAPTADGSDTLIVFDASNPSGYTTIGTLGVSNIGFGGLDFDAEGNMFGYASFIKNTGGAAAGLYSINPDTGAATPIGSSVQSLQDIAYNPTNNTLYGINSRFQAESKLYSIDMDTGAVAEVGTMSGLPATHHLGGFGIDSQGNFFVQDFVTDSILVGDGLNFSHLYDMGIDTNYSQGLTIDWSNGDTGYHGAVGQGVFPDYFSTINTFATDGSGYNAMGPNFGPNDMDGLPPVEPGDLAIRPIPAPASSLALLGASCVLTRRRR